MNHKRTLAKIEARLANQETAKFQGKFLREIYSYLKAKYPKMKVTPIRRFDYGGEEPGLSFDILNFCKPGEYALREGNVSKAIKKFMIDLARGVKAKPPQFTGTGGGWVFYLDKKGVNRHMDDDDELAENSVSYMFPEGKDGVLRFSGDLG